MITLYYYTNILPMPQAVETPFMRYAPTLLPTVVPLASPAVGTLPVNPTLSYQYLVSFSVEVDDSSYRYRQLMQKPQLVLKFSLPVYVDFPVGTWCVYQNQTYRLNSEKNLTKNGKRNITYQMTLGGDEDNLALYKMRNSVDGRLKYSMCAQPREFIEEIVANLNKREGSSVWSVGECIEATEKTVEFNHCYIDAALQSVADEFETEWEIVNHVISLHKVEYFKENPLPLSYGRGNGFVPGLGRTTNSDEAPIKRIYTQGGTRNIDRSKYGGADSDFPEYETTSAELRLPCSQTLEYEGRTYQTDSQGYYVERIDVVSKAVKEDSLDCSEIYPSRVGRVATVTLGTESNALKDHFYDFTDADTSIPNYNDYRIEGETPTIAFQTGMLAGKEFEFKYDHSQRKFKIVPQEIDGIVMPDPATGYMPRGAEGDYEGDQYIILGVMLPKEYICDNEHKTGASWDMFREAARKLYENEDQKFTFKGELQGLWAKRNWLNVGGYLIVGAYIHFTDEQIAPSGVDIRITGIKDYINSPYAPTIEISNSVSGTSIRTELQKIDNTEVIIDDTYRGVLEFTKRRFRDAKETMQMLDDAMLENFNNSITPVSVQTMAMLVGDESLQFQFVGIDNDDNIYLRPDSVAYSNTLKQLFLTTPTAGMNIYLKHYTIGIDSIKSEHEETEYRKWKMSSYASAVLTDGTKRYYVYAKCPKEGEGNGEIVMSETAISMEAMSGYYHFLVGVLNSESDGERSFVTLFGFTEILPGRITTDRIVSSDGTCYFDLANNEIGGAIKFLSDNKYITLIDGGYIRTELINASELVANHIIAGDPDGQRVEISPDRKAVEIYDANGEQCSVFEGKEYGQVSQLFGNTSGSMTILSRTNTVFGYPSGTTLGRGTIASLSGNNLNSVSYDKTIQIAADLPTETPTEIVVSGYIELNASSVGSGSTSGSTSSGGISTQPATPQITRNASVNWRLYIDTFSDEACTQRTGRVTVVSYSASASADAKVDSNYDRDSVSQAFSKAVKVGAGYHRLMLSVTQYASGSSNTSDGCWGFTTGSRNDITATYNSDFYVSRFFANGFCLGTRGDNYVLVCKESSGMRFTALTNGYGIDVSSSGVKVKRGADASWENL